MISDLFQWFQNNETFALLISIASILMFLGFVIVTPVIIVKLPADYFQRVSSGWPSFKGQSPLRIIYLVVKNIAGILLLLAGILMLFLPGQGIITILTGFLLLNLPFKRKIVYRIILKPSVLGTMNRLRARFNRPDFEIRSKKDHSGSFQNVSE